MNPGNDMPLKRLEGGIVPPLGTRAGEVGEEKVVTAKWAIGNFFDLATQVKVMKNWSTNELFPNLKARTEVPHSRRVVMASA